jgi:hypothetical protein
MILRFQGEPHLRITSRGPALVQQDGKQAYFVQEDDITPLLSAIAYLRREDAAAGIQHEGKAQS